MKVYSSKVLQVSPVPQPRARQFEAPPLTKFGETTYTRGADWKPLCSIDFLRIFMKPCAVSDVVPIRTALISVSDKLGLADLAAGLQAAGVEIYSTGGTRRHLEESGIEVSRCGRVHGISRNA